MHRMILLALLILAALPLRADQVETLQIAPQVFSERLGDDTLWYLAQLNGDTYAYSPDAAVYTLTNGGFVVPTPCGTHMVPQGLQLSEPVQDQRAIAQPCIANHTTAYDIIYIMTGSDTAELADNSKLTFRNTRGVVVLSRVQP